VSAGQRFLTVRSFQTILAITMRIQIADPGLADDPDASILKLSGELYGQHMKVVACACFGQTLSTL